jgi:hypothetical protein
MTFSSLVKKLLIFSAALAIIFLALGFIPFFKTFQQFTLISFVYFFLISLLVLRLGYEAMRTKNARRFVALISAAFLGRLLLSAIMIALYAWLAKPKGFGLLIPFTFFYIAYLVFDVIQLISLQKKSLTA